LIGVAHLGDPRFVLADFSSVFGRVDVAIFQFVRWRTRGIGDPEYKSI
jgi:hypothetical protein